MHHLSRLVVLLAVGVFGAVPTMASAQTRPRNDTLPINGRSTGVSLGHVILPGEEGTITLIGFQTTMLRERGTSTEFALYTSPEAAAEGALALVPKISLMSATRQGETWITVKFGANVPVLLAPGSSGGLYGLHAGLGIVLPASPGTVLRLEVEPHVYGGLPIYPPILLLSIGLASRPARKQ